jgi:hypothetical protein
MLNSTKLANTTKLKEIPSTFSSKIISMEEIFEDINK